MRAIVSSFCALTCCSLCGGSFLVSLPSPRARENGLGAVAALSRSGQQGAEQRIGLSTDFDAS